MTSSNAESRFSNKTSLSLLQRAKSDDQEAWEKIVQLYGPLVYSWLRRAGLSNDDMSDVFQDTFRAVAQGLVNFKPNEKVGSFRAWLRTVTRSKVANFYKSLSQRPAATGGTEANVRFAEVADPFGDESVEDVETDEALLVRRALDLIKPDFSENSWTAFCNVAIEGKEVKEMAKKLGMTDQAIRQAIYRIRRRLRQELEGLLDWPDL